MNEPTNAPATSVPGPRTTPLAPPPETLPAGPQDDNLTDEMEETYWSVHDGAAASASVRQILVSLPKITALIGRLAWQAGPRTTVALGLVPGSDHWFLDSLVRGRPGLVVVEDGAW